MKALVLAKQRSGSTLLIEMLNSHPDILGLGEIIEYCKSDRARFRKILNCPPNSVPKIMYNQLTKSVEDYLIATGVKIIHLKRLNYAKRLVSEFINMNKELTGRKEAKSYKKLEPVKIEVSMPWFREQYLEDIKDMAHFKSLFRFNPYMEVIYEDMTGGEEVTQMPEEIARPLLDFLEVPYHPLTTKLRKQNPTKLEDFVLNYNEIKEFLNDCTQ
jgi:hypothetical protein